MSQDTNVLQISSKLAQMSENRQPKAHFCNTTVKAVSNRIDSVRFRGQSPQASQVNAESEGVGLRVFPLTRNSK